MTKVYNSGRTLQDRLLNGIEILADNVASTLGPRGRNVLLGVPGKIPIATKDGVTVAGHVVLEDEVENAGAQLLKQAAIQTNNDAGDGTTTSTVLARSIYKKSQQYLAAGVPPIELKRGIDKAVVAVVKKLKESASSIKSEEDIAHIATISANGDRSIGTLIAKATDLVGKDGAITVEEARSLQTTLEVVEGFRFDSGYAATAFITDERRGIVKYDDPLVLVTDRELTSIDEFMPVLELVARENKPFLVVADDIDGQLLAAFIMNAMRGTLKIAAVKAPRYGEERRGILSDLALSTGAAFITRSSGKSFRDVKLADFGKAQSVEISKGLTTIVDGAGDTEAVAERIEALKTEIEQTESLYDAERLQERVTRLASGIAIIKVGAATEFEMIEKKHRIEDALEASRAAQLEGVVVGGGVALLRAVQNLDVEVDSPEQGYGVEIIKESALEPIKQMALNAGDSPDLVVSEVVKGSANEGWNFETGALVNMFEQGVIDPVKVTTSALQNAASISSTLITTNFSIIEKKSLTSAPN